MFACQTDSLHNDWGCATLEPGGVTAERVRSLAKPTVCTTILAVRRSNRRCGSRTRIYVRLPNRQFAHRSWLCNARTVGVAAERIRSLAKPTVCTTILAVRRAVAPERVRSLATPTVRTTIGAVRRSNRRCDSRTRKRVNCLSVWQENVRVRLSNRWRTVG